MAKHGTSKGVSNRLTQGRLHAEALILPPIDSEIEAALTRAAELVGKINKDQKTENDQAAGVLEFVTNAEKVARESIERLVEARKLVEDYRNKADNKAKQSSGEPISPTSEPKSFSSIVERLSMLEAFAKQHEGKGVADYARSLFPELLQIERAALKMSALPTVAPATWKADKQDGETPPAFVKRVYGEWLGKGFTRATLRHLDPPLAQAMTNWLRHNEMPADVDLPTLKEQNTRWVERVEKEGLAAAVPAGSPEATLREASRLLAAKHRRKER
jgi:hypothetical protein